MLKNKTLIKSIALLSAISLLITGCSNGGRDSTNQDLITDEATSVTEQPIDPSITEPDTKPSDAPIITPEVFPETPEEIVPVSYSRVSVHDPSIIKVDNSYYIFGSHRAWAKSDDLMKWTMIRNNINDEFNDLLGNIWEDYMMTSSNKSLAGNLWAPDVIYNRDMNKYCMYMSVNGNDWNSAIVLLTSDSIEGPFEYIGPVVYSGFNNDSHPVEKTDVYKVLGENADISRYQSTSNTKLNAIDPNVLYDDEGNLWMCFGSWFGGLYMLRLDKLTGLRDYSYTYITEEDKSDQYYGYKIAGGRGVSGEGPYIHKVENYYYLFVSYGGLSSTGGYQMRVFRSNNITGPYEDQNGNPAVYSRAGNNLNTNIGIRLMGSYDFTGKEYIQAAQGHNSVFTDDDGKSYVVFHTRFARGQLANPEQHEVRVHQLFLNSDGWLLAAPYEYSGESLPSNGYNLEEMIGEYEFVIHEPKMFHQIVLKKIIGVPETKNIALYSNGTVQGDLTGSWTYEEGTPYMTITLEGVEYKGLFVKQANESTRKLVMTFTVLGDNVTAMGSK